VNLDLPDRPGPVLSCAVYHGGPAKVLDAFWKDTGRPTELPPWVFRLWASGNEWNTQAQVLRQAELHRSHGIPLGVMVVEAWSDESTYTVFRDAQYEVRQDGAPQSLHDFTFPADGAWPDPVGMVNQLHAADVKLILWQVPIIKVADDSLPQTKAHAMSAMRENILVRVRDPDGRLVPYRNRGWWFPGGLLPDLSDPRAARWWTDRRRYLVDEIGVDGFKTDGGEHAWGSDLVYLDGTNGTMRNNEYPRHYVAAYGDLLASNGKARVTFSRAGFTGSQVNGAFWAGDERSTWEAFRWSMLAGLNAAASGVIYWGWDIAGFSGPIPDAELYVRAMAASVFVPVMQYHSEYNHHRLPSRDRTPWNIAQRTGGAALLDEVRRLVNLRERLVPYLTKETKAAILSGRPLMCPLYFDHPDDRRAWTVTQWYLGRDLLVAPVLEPHRAEWETFLPAGRWVHAWTGARVSGGCVVTSPAPRDQIPIYVPEASWANGLRTLFNP
jgi:alpha-glucosidase (family GH31 glycosyl hydrolase)